MTNYTKTTNFATKDTLPSGNANKIVKGTEIDTEFNNIATAVATKADANNATLTGTTSFETISDGTISITAFVDEDNMASDSATLLPTQQSVKAYVDSQVTAQDLDFQADTGGALSIDLDSETLTFTGGTGIDTSGALNAVTFAIDSTVATLTGSQTLSNKTLSTPVVSGNLTTDGLIDGRDVATDGTKLDGIESGATADQTAAEIRTLVESATDSNVFTDADHSKLNGIEASADVTDTANVTAAGALMDSELTDIAAVKALDQGVATTDSPTFAGLTTTADVSFGDNDKAIFGAGSDLQIYHDGSNSHITDAGTGDLVIRGANVEIQTGGGNRYFTGQSNVARLFHTDIERLRTSNAGINVTGTAVTDGLTMASGSQATIGVFGTSGLQLIGTTGGDNIVGTMGASEPLIFRTVSAERMRIDSSGNVGIGESSPAEKLEVAGNILLNASNAEVNLRSGATGTSGAVNWTFNTDTSNFASIKLAYNDRNTTGLHIDSGYPITLDASGSGTIFAQSGNEKARIDSSGNLLVRQTSAVVRDTNTGGDVQAFWGNQFSSSSATTSKVMIGSGSSQGYVGMSRVNTDSKYIINSYIRFDNTSFTAGSESGSMSFYTQDGGTNAAERMRIDTSGNLLLSTTSIDDTNGAQIVNHYDFPKTGIEMKSDSTAAHFAMTFRNPNGLIGNITTTGSATSFNTSSDQRLKENIADADDAGNKVDAIQVRKFDWIADGSHQDYGMIAQELLTVAPEAVSAPEDPEEMMGVDYSKLVPMLVKEIQSLRARVNALES